MISPPGTISFADAVKRCRDLVWQTELIDFIDQKNHDQHTGVAGAWPNLGNISYYQFFAVASATSIHLVAEEDRGARVEAEVLKAVSQIALYQAFVGLRVEMDAAAGRQSKTDAVVGDHQCLDQLRAAPVLGDKTMLYLDPKTGTVNLDGFRAVQMALAQSYDATEHEGLKTRIRLGPPATSQSPSAGFVREELTESQWEVATNVSQRHLKEWSSSLPECPSLTFRTSEVVIDQAGGRQNPADVLPMSDRLQYERYNAMMALGR